jgi:outer membrane protein assembly factor BamB
MGMYRYIIQTAMIVTVLFIQSSNTALANEPNWPQFRGPGGLGIAPDNQTYPTVLDISHNLLWKTEVPKGHSSPCIWGDNIFITASSGKNLETICINRGNGEIKWRMSVEPETMEKITGSNSYASPTPVCNGKNVYMHFGSFGLLAYDMNGNEVWRKPLPISNVVHGSASSPILANNMVILHRDPDGPNYGGRRKEGEYILALDENTGETIWKQVRQMDSPGWSTPVLWKHGNEQELVVLGGGHLICYDLKDGHKRWWFDGLPTMLGAALTPVYAGDTLFVAAAVGRGGDPVNPIELPDFNELLGTYDSNKDNRLIQAEIPEDMALIYRTGPEGMGVRNSFSGLDTDHDGALSEAEWNKVVEDVKNIAPREMDALVAIRAGGEGDISQSHVLWRAYEGIGQVPSPLFYQGRIYLVKHAGNVTCYDAKTGDKIYGDRVGPRVYYFASPVAADNKIYFCSSNGIIIVVQAGDEFKILAQNRIEERIYATPALVDGKIYLRTDRNMYAFFNAKDESGQIRRDIVVKEERNQAKSLYEATANGNIELVKSLISSGADVNTPNIWGWTPLYIASGTGKKDIVKLLVTEGADVNAPNKTGETPLHFAVSNGQRDIVELLLDHGADMNVKNNSGQSPLFLAFQGSNKEITELLIDKGADINITNNNGLTLLHLAARNGQKDAVELLLTKGADFKAQNRGGRTAAGLAKEYGHSEIFELLSKHANQSGGAKEIMTIYDYAAVGDIEQLKSLISEGADVSAKSRNGMIPLHWAALNGHKDIVELLIQKGADVNAGPQTPLLFACQRGKKDVIELLISKGADINVKNNSGQMPIHFLARDGYTDIVELLIAKGADVNVKDRWIWTPLHYACWRNHKETVELLLAKGADLNAIEEEGKTPLKVAEEEGSTEIVELLKKHGAKE